MEYNPIKEIVNGEIAPAKTVYIRRHVMADSVTDIAYNADIQGRPGRPSIIRVGRAPMDERTREPTKITAEDINPRYN